MFKCSATASTRPARNSAFPSTTSSAIDRASQDRKSRASEPSFDPLFHETDGRCPVICPGYWWLLLSICFCCIRLLKLRSSLTAVVSRCLNEAGRGAVAPHFRLLEICGGDRPVERCAKFLGAFEGQLDAGARAGFEAGVDEVERDDVRQGRMTRVVIGDYRLCQRKPFVPALCHALCVNDLDNG